MLSTFLWTWSPNWLDGRINTVISVLDPSGFRWLDQTYIEIDRGADFYNAARVAVDPGFQLNRFAIVAIGLLGVLWAQRSLAGSLRRAHGEQSRRARRAAHAAFEAASKGTGRGGGRAESAGSLSVVRITAVAGPRAADCGRSRRQPAPRPHGDGTSGLPHHHARRRGGRAARPAQTPQPLPVYAADRVGGRDHHGSDYRPVRLPDAAGLGDHGRVDDEHAVVAGLRPAALLHGRVD